MKLLVTLLLLSAYAHAKSPDCSGTDRWATQGSLAVLKTAGLTSYEELEWSKTKTTLVASEEIGKDLYRQVHRITFVKRDGSRIDTIAVNNASSEECSMSEVEVFVVSRMLGVSSSVCPRVEDIISGESKLLPPSAANGITKDMTISEILKSLGPAARDVGSGLHVLQWDLTNGRVFYVSTPDACSKPMGFGYVE